MAEVEGLTPEYIHDFMDTWVRHFEDIEIFDNEERRKKREAFLAPE